VRLYTYETNGGARIGAARDGRLVDVGSAFGGDMLAFVRAGREALEVASAELATATPGVLLSDVRLRAPLPRPGKVLCSGVNYHGHLKENPNATLPEFPFFFAKLPSAIVGPGEPIVLPRMSRQVDFEVELAVVIGRRMRHASEHDVEAAVFGYTILHDVSARDVQFKDSQITLGKNFDTFAPMGPCIVTADELPDVSDLRLRTFLNGRTMQDDSTRDWVFPLARLLSLLSQVMSLEPGDVVSTGTPAGVGYFRTPQVFLRPGDRVVLEVQGVGRLENPVVSEG
jgi:2-keto-4-pentenoate hydratase/2-oxohepta-3-ene-1,7-dioic acid hydratase in catechol pathway